MILAIHVCGALSLARGPHLFPAQSVLEFPVVRVLALFRDGDRVGRGCPLVGPGPNDLASGASPTTSAICTLVDWPNGRSTSCPSQSPVSRGHRHEVNVDPYFDDPSRLVVTVAIQPFD